MVVIIRSDYAQTKQKSRFADYISGSFANCLLSEAFQRYHISHSRLLGFISHKSVIQTVKYSFFNKKDCLSTVSMACSSRKVFFLLGKGLSTHSRLRQRIVCKIFIVRSVGLVRSKFLEPIAHEQMLFCLKRSEDCYLKMISLVLFHTNRSFKW